VRNRMREICASGSVGGEGGNALAYPAISCRRTNVATTGENDPQLTTATSEIVAETTSRYRPYARHKWNSAPITRRNELGICWLSLVTSIQATSTRSR
jgi:hypothetical protein